MASGRKTGIKINLTEKEKFELGSWQRSTSISAGLAKRGLIILLLSSGHSILETSRKVNINDKRVYKWAYRFLDNRIDGLNDKPGTGRRPVFPP